MQATSKSSVTDNRAVPVLWWATVGTLFVLLTIYIFGSWISSPLFRPAPTGPDPLPHNVLIAVRACETVNALLGLGVFLYFILIPLIRKRYIPPDGLLVINFLLIWWMDPMVNYLNFSFAYNSYSINMGSWAAFIPGWSYPNPENFPEPFMMIGFYLSYNILTTLLGCLVLRKLHDWGLGLFVRLLIVFVMFAALDVLMEQAICSTGLSAYPGVVGSLSIMAGEVSQWPLYQCLAVSIYCVGFTLLRYSRNDQGQTFVERGMERLSLSSGKKRLVSFLALAGFIQPWYLLGFFVTYNSFMHHVDSFPAYPSYLRDMMCGEGTDYACPDKEWVPIPTRTSKIFVRPDDPRLPQEVRDRQGISAFGKDPYARN